MENILKMNVFIPTMPRDFKYLKEIVLRYMNGSQQPNKIIISISSYKFENKLFFDDIEKMYNNIIIIRDQEKLLSAESREKAKNYDCDVVVFQDSDDLPHPDRLKIISYYFNKYHDIMHIHHNYIIGSTPTTHKFNEIKINNIKEHFSTNIYDYYFPNGDYKYGVNISKNKKIQAFTLVPFLFATGVGAYKIEVLNNIKWSSYNYDFMYENPKRRGQDYEYFMKSIYKYNKALFLDAKLYYYNKVY